MATAGAGAGSPGGITDMSSAQTTALTPPPSPQPPPPPPPAPPVVEPEPEVSGAHSATEENVEPVPEPAHQPPAPPRGGAQPERTVNLLRQRLTELGVPEHTYRIGEPAAQTWYLEQVDEGWHVGWFDGEFSSPMLFEEIVDASAFLLGKLLLGVPAEGGLRDDAPGQSVVADQADVAAVEHDEPPVPEFRSRHDLADDHPEPVPPGVEEPLDIVDDHVNSVVPEPQRVDDRAPDVVPERSPDVVPPPGDWPIQPMSGEPPLTLFRGKRLLELQPGTELDRFGGPEGNLTYVAGTPFEQRSLVPEWVHRPYHLYRVTRPIQALTGGAIPWFEQPGGGTAYLLSRAVEELVGSGELVEVEQAEPPGN
jgi:hypothetical protein